MNKVTKSHRKVTVGAMARQNSLFRNIGNIAPSSMYGTKNQKRPTKRTRIGKYSKLNINIDPSDKGIKMSTSFKSGGGDTFESMHSIIDLVGNEESSLNGNSKYQAKEVIDRQRNEELNISVDLVGSTDNVPNGDTYDSISDEELNFSPNLFSQISNEPLITIDDDVEMVGHDGIMFVKEFIQSPSRSMNLICSQHHDRVVSRPTTKYQKECEPLGDVKDQDEMPNFGENLHLNRKRGTKRTVIVDGSNVAFNHSGHKEFSVEGIAICINYFVKQGYDVKVIIPKMRQKWHKSTNPKLLSELAKQKKIIFSPSKNLPDKNVSSYDDRMILDVAHRIDAVVISNDDFRDLREEKEEYMKIVKSRVIGFAFCDDEFFIAPDPYGKNGPSAEAILTRRD